jgi:nitroreductase
MPVTRRLFFPVAAATLVVAHQALGQTGPEDPLPEGYAGTPLRDALAKRESVRQYTRAAVEDEQLMALLWSANGVNRPDVDGRTAPSWRTAKDTEIYVARASGVDWFDATANKLVPVSDADIRNVTSPQPFVGTAPVILIYVSERSRVLKAGGMDEQAFDKETEDHRIAAHVNAAMVSQNVYLFCAAEGLGTCLVGGVDRAAIAGALGLSEGQRVTYVQPVGHPA